jgi:hypothetical protein
MGSIGSAREGYDHWTALCQRMVDEKWRKLEDNVRIQILWITSELVRVKAKKVESVLYSLLRSIGSGHPTTVLPTEHIRTAASILAMFSNSTGNNPNRQWLLLPPHPCVQIWYHYLRLLQEPLPPDLRTNVIKFILDLFNDMVCIGLPLPFSIMLVY